MSRGKAGYLQMKLGEKTVADYWKVFSRDHDLINTSLILEQNIALMYTRVKTKNTLP